MASKQMEGQKAPEFTMQDQDGKTWSLVDFAGKPLVVYFYPKDDTPGCTKEACAFRDRQADLQAAGAQVVGVSPDDVASHRKFHSKFDLNFPLLADPDHAVCEAFNVWKEKNMYGKRFWGADRATFLIDGDGIIRKVWGRVQVDGHDDEVLEALGALTTASA